MNDSLDLTVRERIPCMFCTVLGGDTVVITDNFCFQGGEVALHLSDCHMVKLTFWDICFYEFLYIHESVQDEEGPLAPKFSCGVPV